MFPFRADSHQDRPVIGCYPSKVYFVSDHRNAFNCRQSSNYSLTSSFWTTLKMAKQYAESSRRQGSQFTIDEIPAVVFDLTKLLLLVVEINTPLPFERFFGTIPKGPTLHEVAR